MKLEFTSKRVLPVRKKWKKGAPSQSFVGPFSPPGNNPTPSGSGGAMSPGDSEGLVILQASFDGADGATTGTVADDESQFNRTLTFQNSAQGDTAEKFFGPSSLLININDLVSTPYTSEFILSTPTQKKFLIEAWIKPSAIAEDGAIICNDNGVGGQYFAFRLQTTGELQWLQGASGITFDEFVNTSGAGISPGSWYAVAVDKDEQDKVRIYVNGVMKGSGTLGNGDFSPNVLGTVTIGRGTLSSRRFTGWIDELRVKTGTCIGSDSGYTVRTEPFPLP